MIIRIALISGQQPCIIVRKYWSLFILIFCSIGSFQAQDLTQTIRGKVIDADLENPLPGAVVWVTTPDSLPAVITDLDGRFKIPNVPVGRVTVHASFTGYKKSTIPSILVSSAKETVLNIRIQESIRQMKEVVVSGQKSKAHAENEMATVSARAFSVEETSRFAGSFNDPGRMAQSFAGVSSNNDASNEIVIRGNSPRGVLWRIEGIETPSPNHFAEQGASGGAISMLSSNMMTKSDFFTGAFPAEYGNALSGVFDIRLRPGNNEKREYSFEFGVLGTDISLEGPFKTSYQGSYLVNYRYSTLSMMNALGLDIIGDAVPIFQDISFKVDLPAGKKGHFSIFGIGGQSEVEQEFSDFRNDLIQQLGIFGVSYRKLIGDRTALRVVAAGTGTRNHYKEEEPDTTGAFYEDYSQNFINTAYRLNIQTTTKFNAKHTVRAGVIGSIIGFDLQSGYYDENLVSTVDLLNESGSTGTIQSYVSWRYRWNERWILNTGIHHLHFLLNNNYSVEPRLGVQWIVAPRHKLNFGVGVHSRVEDPTIYLAEVETATGEVIRPNENLDFTRAAHIILGYDHMATENFHIKPEVYYQYLFQVPIGVDSATTFSALNYGGGYTTDSLINDGTGFNYGIDLTLEKFFADQWFVMFTASLFESKYVDGAGIIRDTRYNANYAFNLSLGKEFNMGKKGKNLLGYSIRGNWAGGRRFTPILLDESIAAGYTVRDENVPFSEKAEDYIRIDVQLNYRINRPKTSHIIKIDVQNLLNRRNMWSEFYDPNQKTIVRSTQMGLIPVFSYAIEF